MSAMTDTGSGPTVGGKKRVVIVGGGFAGVSIAKALDKLVSPSLEVVLIDTKDHFENTGAIFKVFADPSATPPSAVQVPHTSYLRNAELVVGEVTGATPGAVVVRLGPSASVVLPYDVLVVATGCSYPLAKEQGVSRSFRAEWLLQEAQLIARARSITIVGAGPTGIELCGNIISRYSPKETGKVVNLVHSHDEVLHRSPAKARKYVAGLLRDAGVRMYLGHRVVDVDVREDTLTAAGTSYVVRTDKGLSLDSDRIYVCTGPIPNTGFLRNSDFADAVTAQGFVRVDKHMRMAGHENVFVAGDIADLPEEKLAERALAHGEVVVKNIRLALRGKPPTKSYRLPKKEPLIILSLGINAAVATEAGHCVSMGEKTAAMKRSAELSAARLLRPKGPSELSANGGKKPQERVRRTSSLQVMPALASRIAAFFNFDTARLTKKTVLALSKSGANVLLCTPKNGSGRHRSSSISKYVRGIARIAEYEKDSVWDFTVLLQGACVVVYQPPLLRDMPEEQIVGQLSMILEASARLKIRKFIMPVEHCTGAHQRCALTAKLVAMVEASEVPHAIVKFDKELGNPFMRTTKPKVMLQKTLVLPLQPEISQFLVNVNDVRDVLANTVLRALSVDQKLVDSIPSKIFVAAPAAMSGAQMASALSAVMGETVMYLALDLEVARARLGSMGVPEELHECILHPGRLATEEIDPDVVALGAAMKEVAPVSKPTLQRSQSSTLAIKGANSEYVAHLLGHQLATFDEWVVHHWDIAPSESEVLEDLIQRGGIEKIIAQTLTSGKELVRIADPARIKLGPAIGRGASGTVFKGEYNGIPVAVKKFIDEYWQLHLDEFRQEAALMSVLRHPNLVRCIAVSVTPNDLLLVMELLERGSLEGYLAASTEPLPFALQQKFALEIAKGMAFLHAAGVIHRDLKCSNVLLTDSLVARITDFGTARPLPPKSYVRHDAIGTAQYMAPEQLKDEKYSHSADVYSFAMVLWQLAVRKIPWAGMRSWEVHERVSKGDRPPLISTHPFYNIITACWAQKPSKRPTFRDLINDIEKVTATQAPPPPVTSRTWSGLVSFLKRSSARSKSADQLNRQATPSLTPRPAEERPPLPPPHKMDQMLKLLRNPVDGVLGGVSMHSLQTYSAVFTAVDILDWARRVLAEPNMAVVGEACRWLVENKHILCIAAPAGSLSAAEIFPTDSDSLFQLPQQPGPAAQPSSAPSTPEVSSAE